MRIGLRIGYRTIKTAIGAAISIFISQQLGLSFYVSAGIITILCIQVTRKQSLQTALKRFAACLIGLIYGYLFYQGLGYHPWTIAILLLLFIPVLVRLKISEGFITSTVVVLQLYTLHRMDLSIIWNQLLVLTVGIGVALLINLYMPNADQELKRLQASIETNFAKILKEFSIYLRNGNTDWDGKEMIETAALLKKALVLAIREQENRLFRVENSDYQYFAVRERQLELLERMLPIVSTLYVQLPQGQHIADFLEEMSNNVQRKNTAYLFLDKLTELRQEIDRTPLPQTQEEFEIRASLFYLMRELEQYLFIKHELGKTS